MEKTFPVPTKFHAPKDVNEARRQANICERAETLFQTGYTMEEVFGGGGMTFKVVAEDGHGYEVNTIFNECCCPSFENDGDCKHRIAVALEVAREAAQVAALEEENRWWLEAGFESRPLYC
ncbi:MAG TPA: SWIM zinc finger family protein [Chthonomonadaceae bacterium]|nr:SWIM zinc finger family protein [Chthonomonadaceae bacterium]